MYYTRNAKYFTYSCLDLLVHCLGLGLGLERHCLSLGLGTYCLAPITDNYTDKRLWYLSRILYWKIVRMSIK